MVRVRLWQAGRPSAVEPYLKTESRLRHHPSPTSERSEPAIPERERAREGHEAQREGRDGLRRAEGLHEEARDQAPQGHPSTEREAVDAHHPAAQLLGGALLHEGVQDREGGDEADP